MAKRKTQKKKPVANNTYYKSRQSANRSRPSVLSLWLLMALFALFVYMGVVGLNKKNYLEAIGASLICVFIAVVFVHVTKKKRIEFDNIRTAEKIDHWLLVYQAKKNEARWSETISDFIVNYDKAIEAVECIASVEPDHLVGGMLAQGRVIELNNSFQEELKHKIDREKYSVLHDLDYKYKHSMTHKKALYNEFWREIELNKDRYSEETKIYADKAVEAVFQASGSEEKEHYQLSNSVQDQPIITDSKIEKIIKDMEKREEERNKKLAQYTDYDSSIDPMAIEHASSNTAIEETDSMSGLDFEKWCANVLKKNGFMNVRVTPGSNDQGVDVLAEKDGIKYAIQCKCYSNDLGNTPVQEVSAGKKFYDCHVGAVMTNSHFTKGAVALAKKTGVLLWDREVVARMAEKE